MVRHQAAIRRSDCVTAVQNRRKRAVAEEDHQYGEQWRTFVVTACALALLTQPRLKSDAKRYSWGGEGQTPKIGNHPVFSVHTATVSEVNATSDNLCIAVYGTAGNADDTEQSKAPLDKTLENLARQEIKGIGKQTVISL